MPSSSGAGTAHQGHDGNVASPPPKAHPAAHVCRTGPPKVWPSPPISPSLAPQCPRGSPDALSGWRRGSSSEGAGCGVCGQDPLGALVGHQTDQTKKDSKEDSLPPSLTQPKTELEAAFVRSWGRWGVRSDLKSAACQPGPPTAEDPPALCQHAACRVTCGSGNSRGRVGQAPVSLACQGGRGHRRPWRPPDPSLGCCWFFPSDFKRLTYHRGLHAEAFWRSSGDDKTRTDNLKGSISLIQSKEKTQQNETRKPSVSVRRTVSVFSQFSFPPA